MRVIRDGCVPARIGRVLQSNMASCLANNFKAPLEESLGEYSRGNDRNNAHANLFEDVEEIGERTRERGIFPIARLLSSTTTFPSVIKQSQ